MVFNAKGSGLTRMKVHSLHQRWGFIEVMQCVELDQHDIIHFEFFNSNKTLNAVLYSQQLQLMHEYLLRKLPVLVNRKKPCMSP